jgi:hypothetical protein
MDGFRSALVGVWWIGMGCGGPGQPYPPPGEEGPSSSAPPAPGQFVTTTATTSDSVDTGTRGVDGWSCDLVNDACWCDDVWEYPRARCPGEWSCCIYWPGEEGNACECSRKQDAECRAFLAEYPETSRVEHCPAG